MKNVIVGTTFMDIKGYPEGAFLSDGRNSGRIEYVHGGVGRNIAENLGNCGCHPTFVSTIDDSALSDAIIKHLDEVDVDHTFVKKAENGMGTWMAIFNEEGDVVSSLSKRPDLSAMVSTLEKHGDEIFSDADAILAEIDMEQAILEQIIRYAEKYQKEIYGVISNMGLALEQDFIFDHISCLICNQQEAGMLYSMDSKISPEQMLEELKKHEDDYAFDKIIVTMGGEGAVYYQKSNKTGGVIPAIPTEVNDTTGAGDAFFSGVSIGLSLGKTLEESGRFGAYLSSLVIKTEKNTCPIVDMEEFFSK